MSEEIKMTDKRRKNQKKSIDRDFSHIDWDKAQKLFDHDTQNIISTLQKEKDNSTHTKDILKLLAAGAVIGISLAVPTFPLILAPFIPDEQKLRIKRMRQTVRQLRRHKLVEVYEKDGEQFVRISKKGKMRVLHYKLNAMSITKPKKWDRKWRVVVFDIPEKYKRYREIFRVHLKNLGFYLLQDSVWAYPYSCFDEIEFLREIYHIDINVTYMVVEKLENDDTVLTHFHLS